MHRLALLIAVVAGVLLAPAAARAGTVSGSVNELAFTGGAEVNDVTVTRSGNSQTITDAASSIVLLPLSPCSQDTPNSVTCPASPLAANLGPGDDALLLRPGVTDVRADGETGADRMSLAFHAAPVRLTLDGRADDGAAGDGHDVAGFERLVGGSSADILASTGGGEALEGRDGADAFDGGLGPDAYSGGAGVDTVYYSRRTAAVSVTLGDPGANDGEAGENDRLPGDVEAVVGGAGNDRMTGAAIAETFAGGGGNDTLWGGGGADRLVGEEGDDRLDGGTGADVFDGGGGIDVADFSTRTANVSVSLNDAKDDGQANEGDDVRTSVDTVLGGSGADGLSGSTGADTLRGGGGDDTLNGGLGPDRLEGGGGVDGVTYAGRNTPLRVALDGSAASGASGEGDAVATDVENARGGEGDDTLSGATGPNGLFGGGGVDTVTYAERTAPLRIALAGGAVSGAAGERDTLGGDVENARGGAGADVITGTGEANVLGGGSGDDDISGSAGDDELYGGDGDDELSDEDGTGTDTLACGRGLDVAAADEGDDVAFDCETLRGGIALLDLTPPDLAVLTRQPKLTRANRVRLRLACPNERRGCGGRVRIETVRKMRLSPDAAPRRHTLGRGSFRLRSSRAGVRTVKLSGKVRVLLRGRSRLAIRLRFATRDVLGNRASLTTRLPLSRAK